MPQDSKDDFKLNLFPEQMSIGGSKKGKDENLVEINLESEKSMLQKLV